MLQLFKARKEENIKQDKREKSLKSALGQYLTPVGVAEFMASLFSGKLEPTHLLDPGAGAGSLARAFYERFPNTRTTTLFECDKNIIPQLRSNISSISSTSIIEGDFIEKGALMALRKERPFSHVIMNPPYKKISCNSHERLCLRDVGIETVNLYSGFVALALMLLAPHGELVAIIPRSFCNGPYYRNFRKTLLGLSSIKRIHLFESRTSAFKSDGVLQENVIISLERDGNQQDVEISTSRDGSFDDLHVRELNFADIVDRGGEFFFRIPDVQKTTAFKLAGFSLPSVQLEVSTGPVVDFRMREHLRKMPEADTAPLLYPGHFLNGFAWPRPDFKKFNSMRLNAETLKWFYPLGWYVVTRRLSSKEEKRRIVANFVDPGAFPANDYLAFENHFNVFHINRRGIPENVARGLAAYLNCARIDAIFRSFNGHTQVNATDLRNLPYPSLELLGKIGDFVKIANPCQEAMDEWLETTLN